MCLLLHRAPTGNMAAKGKFKATPSPSGIYCWFVILSVQMQFTNEESFLSQAMLPETRLTCLWGRELERVKWRSHSPAPKERFYWPLVHTRKPDASGHLAVKVNFMSEFATILLYQLSQYSLREITHILLWKCKCCTDSNERS